MVDTVNFGGLPLSGALTGTESFPLWQSGARRVLLSDLALFIGGGGYTLPVATSTVLGGVKQGSGVTIDGAGVISATPYNLPIASGGALGGVKVGSGLAIAGDGTLSATYSYTLPTATGSVLGGVKVGAGLAIDGGGVLSVAAATLVTESGTTRTALPAHANNYTRFTNAGAKTYTIDGSQAYVAGTEFHGRNMGAGNLTLAGSNGMVLNAPNGGSLAVPINGAFTVKVISATEADVMGVTVAS